MSWTYDEFKAYILMAVAHSDMNITKEEKRYIVDKVGKEDFQDIYDEFEQDTDFQSAQKLMAAAKVHCTTEEKRASLIEEMKALCKVDGEVSVEEKAVLLYLKRILK